MNSEKYNQFEQENRSLKRALDELSILNEIATAINSTMTVAQIVDLIVRKSVKHLKVEQAAIMLLDEKEEEKPFHTMIRQADTSSYKLPYHLDTQLSGWMLKHQKPLLIDDFPNDDRFHTVKDQSFPIRSLLSVPLTSKGRMIGLIAVFNKKTVEGYTSDDQRLLSIIATQSAQVIENARLYEQEQELRNIQHEMQLARDIQINLLPREQPQLSGYDIAGMSFPAKEVGGDYFDFILIDDQKFAVCLGDVSGKGIAAAMLMANLQAIIRGQTLLNLSPKECLRHSNKLLYRSTDRLKFATLFYGILDDQQHELCFANAGHNRPILFKTGKLPAAIETSGIALSFLENVSYGETIVSFNPGDV